MDDADLPARRWPRLPPLMPVRTLTLLTACGGGSAENSATITGADGLVLDPEHPALGDRHHMVQAGMHTDAHAGGVPLTALQHGPGRGLYASGTGIGPHAGRPGRVAAVWRALTEQLDGRQTVRRLHAVGRWDPVTTQFEAARIALILGS